MLAASLPLATVPALRNRLLNRVHALKAAFTGDVKPVMVQAGEAREPFPEEYERLSVPPVAQVFKLPAGAVVYQAPQQDVTPVRGTPRRTIKIPPAGTSSASADEEEEAGEQVGGGAAAGSENQPKYRQGTIEKEAYDLLLQSNSAIAGIVQGGNPSLRFISWDAAGRGEDLYWVRLKFGSEGKPDAEYIWQVQLQSKQITPLNYNARTLQ